MAGGNGVAQAITIIISPLLTRIYTPSDFGIVAIYASVLTILGVLVTCRLELAIVLPASEIKARSVAGAALFVGLISTSFVATFLLLVPQVSLQTLRLESITPYRWLLPIGMLGVCTYQVFYQLTLRRGEYRNLASTRLTQALGGGVIAISGGLILVGPWGLLLAQIGQQTLGVIRLGRRYLKEACLELSWNAFFKSLREPLCRYRSFALTTTGAALLNLVGTAMPPLLVGVNYGEETAGYFGLAFRLVALPAALIGVAVSQVFRSEAAVMIRGNQGDVGALFRKITVRMGILGVLILVGAQLLPAIFPVVFGDSWALSGRYAAILSISAAAQVVVGPVSTIAILKNRPGAQLILDGVRAGLVIGSFLVARWLHWDAGSGILCFSMTMLVTYAIFFLCYWKIAHQE